MSESSGDSNKAQERILNQLNKYKMLVKALRYRRGAATAIGDILSCF